MSRATTLSATVYNTARDEEPAAALSEAEETNRSEAVNHLQGC